MTDWTNLGDPDFHADDYQGDGTRRSIFWYRLRTLPRRIWLRLGGAL